ncbi:MAG: hypothetical protein PHD01_16240 [Geobacteraceae bacterium]|nr:hypothetical protein [Geobacteraceae bacterium]
MNAVFEFEGVLDHIYGVYIDATTGFDKLREWFVKNQRDSLDMLKNSHPELASIDYLDSVSMIYGKGDPNVPESVVLHECSQKEYKERNTENGVNFKFIGNMALVSLYQYWEDHYRSKIAEQFHINKNELKAPVMGDLRLIRISIVHHAGIALKDIEKCNVLGWYKEGDEIFIDKNKFEEIVFQIKSQINQWKIDLA